MLLQAFCIISYPLVNSNWSYSPETPNLGQIRWFFEPWTLPWSLVITPENFMIIRWWEHSQKGVTDGQMDRRTDGQTDRKYHSESCLVAAKNPELILINMFSPTFLPNLVTLAWKMSSGMPKEAGSFNGPLCTYLIRQNLHDQTRLRS